jgi:hypothetical protein
VSYATRQKKIQKRKRQGAIKRNARSPNAKWRSEPATERQREVLRLIAAETGRTFSPEITRGEASELIAGRFAENEIATARHRRRRRERREGGERRAA